MLPDEQQIVRILAESGEPMFPSQIAECLNTELVSGTDYDAGEVIKHLQFLGEQVVQISDGRWTLKRLLDRP
jgi:repressor of nif and glnA expression